MRSTRLRCSSRSAPSDPRSPRPRGQVPGVTPPQRPTSPVRAPLPACGRTRAPGVRPGPSRRSSAPRGLALLDSRPVLPLLNGNGRLGAVRPLDHALESHRHPSQSDGPTRATTHCLRIAGETTMQGIEHEARPQGSAMDRTQARAGERPAWKRSQLIWLLIALSLVPGVAAAAFRPEWSGLPGGVRMTAYIVSGILIIAACAVILREEPGSPAARPDGTGLDDSP